MTTDDHSVEFAGGALGRHRHICALFNSADEEHRVLRSFVKDGFGRRERAFHIVGPEQREEHVKWLAESGIDVGSLIVNRVLPDGLEGEFYAARRRQEAVYRREIDERFAALDRIVIAQLESDVYGVARLERISAQIFG